MKKMFVIMAVAIGISHLAMAQEFGGKLIIGINAAQIDGDDYAGFDKAGLLAGAAAYFPLSDRMYIQPEILYSQKGSAIKINDQKYNLYDLKYIEFPLGLGYHFENNNFVVEAGPMIGMLLKATHEDVHGSRSNMEFSDRFPNDLLGFVGIEYRLTDVLAFNLRFSYSLMPLPDNRFYRNYYNNVLTFSLRLRLVKGKSDE